MVTNEQTSGQKPAIKKVLQRFNQLSLSTKVIAIVVLAFLVLQVVSIPGDRNELLARQARVEAAQTAFDEALPTITTVMENIVTFLDESEVDLSGNQSYTRITGAVTTFTRATSATSSRFQGVVRFSENAHALLDGTNAVEELDTDEYRLLLSDMDTTLSNAWLTLMELNTSIDEYNGYNNWISAKITSMLFGLPQNYPDPIPDNSSLNNNTSLLQQ
jgi:hypothetical protein